MHTYIYKDLFFLALFIGILGCRSELYSQNKFIRPNKKSKDIYQSDCIDLNKNGKKDIYEDSSVKLELRIDDLISQMNINEKTCQMVTLYGYKRVAKDELPKESWKTLLWKDGLGNIDEHLSGHKKAPTEYDWPASKHARALNEVQRFFIEDTRLGIPVDFTNEGIRGLCHTKATCFPAQIGVGSTWNTELVNKIGHITGKEAKATGYTNIYSPVLDLARDPRWGRVVECYGEDPFLVSSYGYEMVTGLQAEGVASTAKHFAVYSIPKGGRDGAARTNPQVSQREMHKIYLAPFKKVVQEANILGLMSSYNDYDGIPISASSYFLTDLLRNQWGFKGYVVSDSWAVGGLEGRHHIADNMEECVYQSVMAGLNVRTDFTKPEDFVMPLRKLIKEGKIPVSVINDRVRDVLRVKFMLGLFDQPYVEKPQLADALFHNKSNEEIALQASRESLVLLKNDDLLPLDKNKLQSILVVGPNAKAIDHSISRYGPSHINVISVYDGIKKLADNIDVQYAKGCDFFDENWPESELFNTAPSDAQQAMIDEAVVKAKDVDVIVLAIGDDERTVGESRSRTSLNLPGNQQQLLEALYQTGKPIVAVLINGRAITINWANRYIPAILEAWFPGEYGGQAIAESLFGLYNPGGKLPVTFPKSIGQLPFNFPCQKSSQAGQHREGHNGTGNTRATDALYPFGHGLSYSTFEYSNFKISSNPLSKEKPVCISFEISNTGKYDGDEVAQLYIRDKVSSVVTYEKELKGFERVSLKAGECKQLTFYLHARDLSLLDIDMNEVCEAGEFEVQVGSSSEDIRLKGFFIVEETINSYID